MFAELVCNCIGLHVVAVEGNAEVETEMMNASLDAMISR